MEQTPPPPLVKPAPSRGWATVLAWVVIVTLTVGVAALQAGVGLRPRKAAEPSTSTDEGKAQSQLQGRILVGLDQLTPGPKTAAQQLDQLNAGPPSQRFVFIVLSGEMIGPARAVEHLNVLLDDPEHFGVGQLSAEDRKLGEGLLALYQRYDKEQYDSDNLPESDRARIKDRLGWVGDLALTPANSPHKDRRNALMESARTAALVYIVLLMGGLGIAVVGFILMVVLGVFMFSGRWRPRVPTRVRTGGVYAETFAIWMFALLALMVAGGLLARWVDQQAKAAGNPQLGEYARIGANLLMALSFVSLAWPVLRGIPFRKVRRDIGLHTGQGVFKEVLAGLAGYVMTIPWGVAGILITVLLMYLQKQGFLPGGETAPSHPIVDELAKRDWLVIGQALFLAAVMAPILEESMFRGVLYTHLRSATRSWGRLLSFLASALVSGLIFAAIHPQGLVAIPALCGLACGFAYTREWRGSLIPSMVGHGLHNGSLLVIVILAMS